MAADETLQTIGLDQNPSEVALASRLSLLARSSSFSELLGIDGLLLSCCPSSHVFVLSLQ